MATVLVTGGAGYIGGELTRQLLAAKHRVICLDRVFFGKDLLAEFLPNPDYALVRDDVRSFDQAVLKGVDVVIDLAGISNDPACDLNPQLTQDINWTGSVRVARLAKAMGVPRYIFVSSCSVYGHGTSLNLTEESALAPVSLYAECKIRSEQDILPMQSPDFCVTVLRLATVYGPSRRMRYDLVVNLMTAKAFHEREIFVLGGGMQWRPNVHVADVAGAVLLVMEQPAGKVGGQIFNVGSNEQTMRVVDIANQVREVLPETAIKLIPDDPDKRSYRVSFDRITRELGYRCRHSIRDGIAEIKQRLAQGTILEFADPRTKTLGYYTWLIKAREILDDVCINGRLF